MDDKYKILLIDDEQPQLDYLRKYLEEGLSKWIEPVEPFLANNEDQLKAVLKKIRDEYYDVIISDLYMPDTKNNGCGGLRVIEAIKEINQRENKNLQLIVISNKEDAGRKVEQYEIDNPNWFKFYKKATPPSTSGPRYESREIWLYALSHAILKLNNDQNNQDDNASQIIGESESIVTIKGMIQRCADTPANILVTGESGTGKDVVAKAIHSLSNRKEKPFVTVNCGAIPDNLIESELFGHEKGAFTGAVSQKKGLFENADKGTLFLDEVGELPLNSQVKLLRALEEGKIHRIGGGKDINIDVKFVFATNKNLSVEMNEKRFREDLYYRINVVQIAMPPLRERHDDIPLLITHFLNYFANQGGQYKDKSFSGTSLQRFLAYTWPGNVRELRNIVERSLVLSNATVIVEKDLPSEIINASEEIAKATENVSTVSNQEKSAPSDEQILSQTKKHRGIDRWTTAAKELSISAEEFENRVKAVICKTYATTDSNKAKTALLLGMRRATLHEWMKKLQIN